MDNAYKPAIQPDLILELSRALWLKEYGREDSMALALHYPNRQQHPVALKHSLCLPIYKNENKTSQQGMKSVNPVSPSGSKNTAAKRLEPGAHPTLPAVPGATLRGGRWRQQLKEDETQV